MRVFAKDAILSDGISKDLRDGPMCGCGGNEEDKRADFAGGEDALGFTRVAAIVSTVVTTRVFEAYICFAWRSRYTWTAVLFRFMTASKIFLITGCS